MNNERKAATAIQARSRTRPSEPLQNLCRPSRLIVDMQAFWRGRKSRQQTAAAVRAQWQHSFGTADLRARCATCCWGTLVWASQQSKTRAFAAGKSLAYSRPTCDSSAASADRKTLSSSCKQHCSSLMHVMRVCGSTACAARQQENKAKQAGTLLQARLSSALEPPAQQMSPSSPSELESCAHCACRLCTPTGEIALPCRQCMMQPADVKSSTFWRRLRLQQQLWQPSASPEPSALVALVLALTGGWNSLASSASCSQTLTSITGNHSSFIIVALCRHGILGTSGTIRPSRAATSSSA